MSRLRRQGLGLGSGSWHERAASTPTSRPRLDTARTPCRRGL
ncbi:hypothetical protein D187_000953 [Cystobacter fuscus DSM 2262]|uniref:Uncharacterized protein n=1 Tax=Cystobacter fuscus (strain ATCC 25194 / DSM 2262 / NBRC 100088 / M29) TaxID=1242864 RepID=S9P9W5_CYSF2|nr:hypothetical protein D187_000953 [Cystobacter fuscus DSM 2262]